MARRKFDRQFQERVIELVRKADEPVAQIARVLGMSESTLRSWVLRDRRRWWAEQLRTLSASAYLRFRWRALGPRFHFKDWLSAVPRVRRRMNGKTPRMLLPVLLILIAVGSAVWVLTETSIQPVSLLYLLYIGLSLLLGATATTTLIWMLYAWRTPDSFAESSSRGDDLEPVHSFSLIVPARHEEAVLATTLARLAESDHPDFEVIIVVGDDDPATREVAERVADRYPALVKIAVDASYPKNKPRALNTALPHCTRTITGVFDAEDDVHPALLHRVDQCFQRTGADIVQGGVQLMNLRSSWLTVHNVLEYYFWFRSRLHRHARQRFIPLGGNTVFIRTPVLQAVAGWDPNSLAEDCELGVRLSALGAHTVVFYEPELVTREECPPTLASFVRQRTRWNQGYLQTLSKGYWRRLSPLQRWLGVYILATPFAMAIAWLLIPFAIATAIFLKAPVPVTLMSFLPLLPMLSMLAVAVAGLGEFCRTYEQRASSRDYARLVLGLPLYQAVLTFSAARAVTRETRGARGWEKTAHLGLHLGHTASTGRQRSVPGRVRRVREAALRIMAAKARPWQVRSPEPVLVEAVGLTPGPVVVALAETGADPHRVFEPYSDISQGNTIRSGEDASPHERPRLLLASGAEGIGNGHYGSRLLLVDSPVAFTDGRPLWMQLDDAHAAAPTQPAPLDAPPTGSAGGGESLRGRLWARFRRLVGSHPDAAVQVPLLIGVGLVQATNLFHWPGPLPDEGGYVSYAWAVGERGVLSNYTYTYGHPPLGWLLITLWTWANKLFGHANYSLYEAREVMCAVSIVSCALLYVLARRLRMSRPFAAGAVIFFALSPLALYFHRAVLLDNPATAWAIAAFALASSPQRRLWSFAGAGACFAGSVLSKETTLVMLPALFLAAFYNTDTRTRRYCLALLGSFFLLIGLAFPLYATLKGELLPGPGHVSLVGTEINQLFSRQGTGSIFNPLSVAHGTVTFWLSLDPWLPWAALLLSPIALARRRTRAIALCFLIQVAIIVRPGYLPYMYVIAQLPFAALIVAGGLQAAWRFCTGNRSTRQSSARQTWWPAASSWMSASVRSAGILGSWITIATAAAMALVFVAPSWARSDHNAMTITQDGPMIAAEHWLIRHVGHQQRLIVSDAFWIYLIEHGFDAHAVKGGFYSRTVVSYWPFDKDPAVRHYFPYSWREFNYIVSTPDMRVTEGDTPETTQALQQSRLLVAYGQGNQRIEIRAIVPTPLGIGTANALRYEVRSSGAAPSLDQLAHRLGVRLVNLIATTNQHKDAPEWWYYEGKHKYSAPLPEGIRLYYTRS